MSCAGRLPTPEGILFHDHLLGSMPDGIVFVDSEFRIVKWNRAMELLTGISAEYAEQQRWDPAVLQLRDERFKLISAARCPVIRAIRQGTKTHQHVLVTNSKRDKVSLDAWVMPVRGTDGAIRGATLQMQDASFRVSLEARVQQLNEKATRDSLTGIANRAEFDGAHQRWVAGHLQRGSAYSLIICDLDYFKRINDMHGHQAGDEALIAFATLLRKYCHNADLVARYGGEEFVMLCCDCDRIAATGRAERIREAWAGQSHAMLNGRSLTASFGVAQLRAGDTGETMLRRADWALLQAKSRGRNAVVSSDEGMPEPDAKDQQHNGWLWWWRRSRPVPHLLQRHVVTLVPLRLAAEKLRGFVIDHAAEIREVAEQRVVLEIAGKNVPRIRHSTDRPTPFLVELNLVEVTDDHDRCARGAQLRTVVQITIRPKRHRDRRRDTADERARELFLRLKSYLMARDDS